MRLLFCQLESCERCTASAVASGFCRPVSCVSRMLSAVPSVSCCCDSVPAKSVAELSVCRADGRTDVSRVTLPVRVRGTSYVDAVPAAEADSSETWVGRVRDEDAPAVAVVVVARSS